MEIDKDFVPSTIEAAVDHIVESLSDEDREFITNDNSPAAIHHTIGRYIRNSWSLWEPDTPLKLDAVLKYGIAHADDISGLILDWVFAKVIRDNFDPRSACERFHEHWRNMGTDSLTAGGWKE